MEDREVATAAHRPIRRVVPLLLIVRVLSSMWMTMRSGLGMARAGQVHICLQDALTATQYGDEIHVAQGIYQIRNARLFSYRSVR